MLVGSRRAIDLAIEINRGPNRFTALAERLKKDGFGVPLREQLVALVGRRRLRRHQPGGERFEAGAQLRIDHFAQGLAELRITTDVAGDLSCWIRDLVYQHAFGSAVDAVRRGLRIAFSRPIFAATLRRRNGPPMPPVIGRATNGESWAIPTRVTAAPTPTMMAALSGSPSASTLAWSFVVKPPRERPIP